VKLKRKRPRLQLDSSLRSEAVPTSKALRRKGQGPVVYLTGIEGGLAGL